MTAYEFLRDTPNPTEEQVREGISGNICRCTGYAPIVQAILEVSEAAGEGGSSARVSRNGLAPKLSF